MSKLAVSMAGISTLDTSFNDPADNFRKGTTARPLSLV